MLEFSEQEPEDRSSVELLRSVVGEGFEAFYDREIRGVIGLAYVLSGSRTAAEDLAQDAFIVVYRNWDKVSVMDNPGAWVRRVVVNRSVSVARRRIAEAKALVRIGRQPVAFENLTTEDDELWCAVRALSRRQAQVIALRYWDHRTAAQIGEILELSEATVKSHLQRGRQVLALTYRKESRS